uniref:Sushi domain-containing protein n=1 Tax=Spermophilus dauricus TaxID=99837 RepID=A0A8C9QPH4_SPEDA
NKTIFIITLSILILTNFSMKPCDFPEIKHGRLYSEERYRPYFPVPIGQQYTYECDNNFVSPSKSYWGYIYCTKEGWLPEVPCIRQCIFNFVENGHYSRETRHLLHESVKVDCYPGYSLSNGQNTVTCTENGWSPPLKCIRINSSGKCGPPPPIDNGDLTSFPLAVYPMSSSVEYQCQSLYQLEGSKTVTCRNGKWSNPPKCFHSSGKCGPPPPIDNGDLTSFPLAVYPMSSSVEYQCQSLYQLEGSKTVTCRNGKWSNPPKCFHACVISEEIMERYHITLRWKEWQKFYALSGDTVEFMCKYGYSPLTRSQSFRTRCIDGHLEYPVCIKRYS